MQSIAQTAEIVNRAYFYIKIEENSFEIVTKPNFNIYSVLANKNSQTFLNFAFPDSPALRIIASDCRC